MLRHHAVFRCSAAASLAALVWVGASCGAAFGPDEPAAAPADRTLDLPADIRERFGLFDGCFVLRELGRSESQDLEVQWGDERCHAPASPCSTFKIPHAMLALETGVLADEHEVLTWDGVQRSVRSWNRDHDLASAIRDSVVWFFQETARRIGAERMRRYVEAFDYGNADTSGGLTTFWLESSLKISAAQQVEFLARLVREDLPISQSTLETVKRLLTVDRGDGWTLYGKTGSGRFERDRGLGWYVGWVERETGPTRVFAVRIGGDSQARGSEARRIARELLIDLETISAHRSTGSTSLR